MVIFALLKGNTEFKKISALKQTFYSEYLIANFRTTAEDFYNKIISYWRVETYH
jgi:hypothetical protein